MANDSRVNLKMVFEILADKEIEELKERGSGSGIFTREFAAVESRGAIPADDEASRVAVCALQRRPASCWAVAASLNGAN